MSEPEAADPLFRSRMAELRHGRGMSFRALGRLTNFSHTYLWEIESGRKPPTTQVAQLLDDALAANGDLALLASVPQVAGKPAATELAGGPSTSGPAGAAPPHHSVALHIRVDGVDVVVPVSRRLLLGAGLGSLLEAFAVGHQSDMIKDRVQQPDLTERLTITSRAHSEEILFHLSEQWHALVRTDNLFGSRFALTGVLDQITVVEALRSGLRGALRLEAVRVGAKYAESAGWLYENIGDLAQARFWTSRAMEWAYECDDQRTLAWTIFRRSQQAAAKADAAQAIGLAAAARRNEEQLAPPTRAAIRVQEAYGHALDGNEQEAQRLLDEAHTWAASDAVGDAREGHGSYCTPGHIEIERGTCWLATGQPKKAIALYENGIQSLPPAYQRNREAALTRLASAYIADNQPDQAASTVRVALPVARNAGSQRMLEEIKGVRTALAAHRSSPAVAALLDDLDAETSSR